MNTDLEQFHSESLKEAKMTLVRKKEGKLYNKILYGVLFLYIIFVLIVFFAGGSDSVKIVWIFFGFEAVVWLAVLIVIVRIFLSYSPYRPKPSNEDVTKEYNAIISKKKQDSQDKINHLQESIEQEKKYFAKLTKA